MDTQHSLPTSQDKRESRAYTRAQAIADGILIDVTLIARQAHFQHPVAITKALHDRLIPTLDEELL